MPLVLVSGVYWCEVPVVDIYKPGKPPEACGANPGLGNPIYPLLGTKREEVDTAVLAGPERIWLVYDSTLAAPMAAGGERPAPVKPPAAGLLWSTSLYRKVLLQAGRQGAQVARGDVSTVSFVRSAGDVYTPDADVNDRLASVAGGGFRFTDAAARSQESYDVAGNLTAIAWASGQSLSLAYSTSDTPASIAPAPGYLTEAQDSFGRVVRFAYQLPQGADPATAGLLASITDAQGQAVALGYSSTGNLTSLTWADGKSRSFAYESADFPRALTGITDERGVRYATFGYDSAGRAISSEHAGGVNRYSVTYATSPQIVVSEVYDSAAQVIYRYHTWQQAQGTQVATPQGTSLAMSAVTINGKSYLTEQSQPAGAGCAASTSAQSYDAKGNLASKDDFNGSRICYASDLSRNLELTRVEGLSNTAVCSTVTGSSATLPTASRKTSTAWHPDWRLTAKVAEPGKLTTSVYHGQPDPSAGGAVASCAPAAALLPDGKPIAVLCKQIEQATSDASGAAGFGAALQAGVPARIWRWTYNASGQMLTATDARNHTTAYSYYASTTPGTATLGDLQSVTNAQGQVTQYTRYDPHGNLLQSTDPNGVVTSATYDLRQRLTSVDVGGQTTSYSYDPVGQLTRVTQADGSAVEFVYDAAHRLTAIADSLGNRVSYTLDNMGNRVAEQVKDAGGNLSRQLSRAFDALNRKQQTVGIE